MISDTLGLFSKAAPLADCLQELLGDVVAFYYQAHAAHWNLTGIEFSQYHEKFEEVYEDVFGSIDPLAENIRKLGAFPASDLRDLKISVPSSTSSREAVALIKALLASNDDVLSCIGRCLKAAAKDNQQGILNFLAERQDMHQKWKWQLGAALG